jgi:ferredoxin
MSGPVYLERSRLEAALAALADAWEVVAPVQGAGEEVPRLVALPAEGRVTLGPCKPLLPLKTFFLPETEDLFHFSRLEGRTTVRPVEALGRDRVVVGALGCDLGALALLDAVFLGEPADEAYRERRERTTVVALACTGEGAECFCASMGIDPLRPAEADALLFPAAEGWVVEALTEKGESVLGHLEAHVRRPEDSELAAAAGIVASSRGNAPLPAPPGGWEAWWDTPVWEDLALLCHGCGVCTAVCPTCHCFDVQDERRGEGGGRFRTWDSCMFQAFTGLAGGENPRTAHAQRFRQRFLHKLAYFPENHGAVACTGCGRCLRSCPQGIGIEEVAARLLGRESSDG